MTDTIDTPAPPSAEHPAGVGVIKPGYHPRLTNDDLAPLRDQNWTWYNIFAFWMSDVHSVGGYVTAGSPVRPRPHQLAGLHLPHRRHLDRALLLQPRREAVAAHGVPFPVICRSVFGVVGANIPAIIRGLIAVAWYGIQTYLASAALDILLSASGRRSSRTATSPSTGSSGCPRSATSPSRCCGCCRPPSSGPAWTPSASSSTSAAPRSTSSCSSSASTCCPRRTGTSASTCRPSSSPGRPSSRRCVPRRLWSSRTSRGRCSTSVTSRGTASRSRRSSAATSGACR